MASDKHDTIIHTVKIFCPIRAGILMTQKQESPCYQGLGEMKCLARSGISEVENHSDSIINGQMICCQPDSNESPCMKAGALGCGSIFEQAIDVSRRRAQDLHIVADTGFQAR